MDYHNLNFNNMKLYNIKNNLLQEKSINNSIYNINNKYSMDLSYKKELNLLNDTYSLNNKFMKEYNEEMIFIKLKFRNKRRDYEFAKKRKLIND